MNLSIGSTIFSPAKPHFARIEGLGAATVHLKLEGINVAGSIKLKPAMKMIEDLEAANLIGPDTHLIESSSGSLGIALSMICANKGYRFTCVTDPNIASIAYKAMSALGTKIVVVTDRDANGGYLGTRISLIQNLCQENPNYIWLNQYANESNWASHYNGTAKELAESFPRIDWLVLGAGTTGTLMGCGRYFKEHRPATRIIAVDAQGSVTFGGPPGRRYIPGLGTSRRPEILDNQFFDEIIYVTESNTVLMCRALAARGMLIGGSTGTVLAGIRQLAERFKPGDVVVAISPDMGEKYLDSIYSDDWVRDRFPAVID